MWSEEIKARRRQQVAFIDEHERNIKIYEERTGRKHRPLMSCPRVLLRGKKHVVRSLPGGCMCQTFSHLYVDDHRKIWYQRDTKSYVMTVEPYAWRDTDTWTRMIDQLDEYCKQHGLTYDIDPDSTVWPAGQDLPFFVIRSAS